jgi:hypothetical protein
MAKHQAVHLEATIPTSQMHVDENGNLVIRNRELSEKVKGFLSSPEGKKIEAAEYHLLCCVLRPPTLLK